MKNNIVYEVIKRNIVLQVELKDLHTPAPIKDSPSPVDKITFAERYQLEQMRKHNTANIKELNK